MIRFNSSRTPSTYLRKQSMSIFSYLWFIIDLMVMVVTTTVIIVLFMRKNELREFFMGRFYLVYIILSVGVFLFSLSVFVKQIRSKSLPVCIMLEFTDILCHLCDVVNHHECLQLLDHERCYSSGEYSDNLHSGIDFHWVVHNLRGVHLSNTNMKRNAADEIMEGYDTSEKNLKRQRLERQPFSVSQVIWFAVDTVWMVLITVAIVISLTIIKQLCNFFKQNAYVKYLILLGGFIPLLLFLFVKKLQMHCLIVRILLGLTVTMWSVCFAALLGPIDVISGLVSLGVTIVLSVVMVVLALKLPPLSEKGLFISLTTLLTVMCLVFAEAVSKFIHKNYELLAVQGVLSCIFVLIMMFIFVNKRQLILEPLSSPCSETFLGFIVWCTMIGLFTQVLICFPSWSATTCPV
uniref:Uncharacterized protein n=1 Tax=Trichobilharzia regenti TaxID=157069 RepID=A0AA85J3C4_TRIRE|nr:unnamed protein product [Trichobilharzia regenti]